MTQRRAAWSSALDPRIDAADRSRGQTAHSKMIIDACKPFAAKQRGLDKLTPADIDAEITAHRRKNDRAPGGAS